MNENVLIDPSERILATIGSDFLQSFLSGGNVKNGVGVLTQKRFYYKGHNFSGPAKDLRSVTEEGVVSIEDVVSTSFSYTRYIAVLVYAIFLTVIAVGAFFALPKVGLVVLLFALLFYVLYFVKRQTLFRVSFPDGNAFTFDVRYYPITDIRNFQRQLHLVKDSRKAA